MKNIQKIFNTLSITEKTIVTIFSALFVFSILNILLLISNSFTVEVPKKGGVLTEGVIGTPRLINPLLAVSETDRSMTNLIYSGLMKNTEDGLVVDLAERYEISEDGLKYRIYLKDDIYFHNEQIVTADDVVFTILAAQNPELKSSKRSNWEGVSIEKINDREIVFTLNQPYAPFLQNLTLGILPKHLWNQVEINEFSLTKLNTEPIGSGPYMVSRIKQNEIGIPTSYTLEAFKEYALGEPYIDSLNLRFYKNQEEILEAYTKGHIDSAYGIDPSEARALQIDGERVEDYPLPRIFGLFFNQSESTIIADRTVREALRLATPKVQVVDNILSGFATIIDSPVPNHLVKVDESTITMSDLDKAQKMLLNDGWVLNENNMLVFEGENNTIPLKVSITTSNVPELSQGAKIVAEAWRSIGIDAEVQTFEASDLNPNVIRPRKFEILLFGLVTGRDLDLYAFWHSSQINDPGLNITSYANITTDDLLEDIRNTSDTEELTSLLTEFNEEIKKDIPAIFIYSPDFIYILPETLGGVDILNITSSDERFMNIHEWYVDVDRVWGIFNF